ncbi:hypothetical protein TetV_478 [Tetraselmis virus 1]|uniref:Fibronectin type-III domain-containing protein n=1 Tax=Tetraselmis virus 1 TaxID=2060617 RepID=A0A2P0VNV8_9VIRU|nr:hypothetical protein QJ968_gp576 [Tetraselmis virus 1]AUF82560.1 hypothetical protein TetV_478 [Tetraselmis virus 1]
MSNIIFGFENDTLGSLLLQYDTNDAIFSSNVPFSTDSDLNLISVGNVVEEIDIKKRTTPVQDNAVTDCNIIDNSVDPSSVFDPLSVPISVSQGGLGHSNIIENSLLTGNNTDPVNQTDFIQFSSDTNRFTCYDVDISGNIVSASNDMYSRNTLYAQTTDSNTVDLLTPVFTDPSIASVSSVVGINEITFQVSVTDNPYPTRTVHAGWIQSPSSSNNPAELIDLGYSSLLVDNTAKITAFGLESGTEYNFSVIARDARGNISSVNTSSHTTIDATDPVLVGLQVEQGAGIDDYEFNILSGTVSDNFDGPLKLYLILSDTTKTTQDLVSIVSSNGNDMPELSKHENVSYTSPSPLGLSTAGLVTDRYWNGSAWTPISDTDPASPYQLYAYVLAEDAAGNTNSASDVNGVLTVTDNTLPVVNSFQVDNSGEETETTIPLQWSVSDNRDAQPDIYITAYTAGSPTPSKLEVYQGNGTGAISTATITNGSTTYDFGLTTYGENALVADTTYDFYLVAEDDLDLDAINISEVSAVVTGSTSSSNSIETQEILQWSSDPVGNSGTASTAFDGNLGTTDSFWSGPSPLSVSGTFNTSIYVTGWKVYTRQDVPGYNHQPPDSFTFSIGGSQVFSVSGLAFGDYDSTNVISGNVTRLIKQFTFSSPITIDSGDTFTITSTVPGGSSGTAYVYEFAMIGNYINDIRLPVNVFTVGGPIGDDISRVDQTMGTTTYPIGTDPIVYEARVRLHSNDGDNYVKVFWAHESYVINNSVGSQASDNRTYFGSEPVTWPNDDEYGVLVSVLWGNKVKTFAQSNSYLEDSGSLTVDASQYYLYRISLSTTTMIIEIYDESGSLSFTDTRSVAMQAGNYMPVVQAGANRNVYIRSMEIVDDTPVASQLNTFTPSVTPFMGALTSTSTGILYYVTVNTGTGIVRVYKDEGSGYSELATTGSPFTLQPDSMYYDAEIDPSDTYLWVSGPNFSQTVPGDGFRAGIWKMDLSNNTFYQVAAAIDTLSVNDGGNFTVKAITFAPDNDPIVSTGHRAGGGSQGYVHAYRFDSSDNTKTELGGLISVSGGQDNRAQSAMNGNTMFFCYKTGSSVITAWYDLSLGNGGTYNAVGSNYNFSSMNQRQGPEIDYDYDNDILLRTFFDSGNNGLVVQYNLDPTGSGEWDSSLSPPFYSFPNYRDNDTVSNITLLSCRYHRGYLYVAYITLDNSTGANTILPGVSYLNLLTNQWSIVNELVQYTCHQFFISVDINKTSDDVYVTFLDNTNRNPITMNITAPAVTLTPSILALRELNNAAFAGASQDSSWQMQYAFNTPTFTATTQNFWQNPASLVGTVTLSVSKTYNRVAFYQGGNIGNSGGGLAGMPLRYRITNGNGGADILSEITITSSDLQEFERNGLTWWGIIFEIDVPTDTTTYYIIADQNDSGGGQNAMLHHIQFFNE